MIRITCWEVGIMVTCMLKGAGQDVCSVCDPQSRISGCCGGAGHLMGGHIRSWLGLRLVFISWMWTVTSFFVSFYWLKVQLEKGAVVDTHSSHGRWVPVYTGTLRNPSSHFGISFPWSFRGIFFAIFFTIIICFMHMSL